MTAGPVVIIGAGHAGFQLAMSLRQHGFSERIALLNDEGHLPYQRPPLSKAYLKGTGGPDSLMFRPEKFYSDQNIDLISDRAVSIDRAARKVLLASGTSLDFGHMVLATGARNRVRYLRTLDESQLLRDDIAPGQCVIVIGAGFIGLEFAATARAKGLEVDVIELAPRVMARAVTAEISEHFQSRHAAAGIRIHLGVQVTSIESDGSKVTGVSLSDGRHIKADLIVVGVGVLPNVELAAEAGLKVAAGIEPTVRRLAAAGVGAERHRPRALRRGPADRRCQALRRPAVVLERSGPRQAADGGADHRLRPRGGARRSCRGRVLRVLLQIRTARRHRVGQSCRRPHVRTALACGQRLDHSRAGGRRQLRPEGCPDSEHALT
jgi:thioredoxin reductase